MENILYQRQSVYVLSLQSFFLLCISFKVSFCSKQDFSFLQFVFACYHPMLFLSVEKLFAFQKSDSRVWLWLLLSADIFSSVFQWNQKIEDANCTIILKGKDIAEFIQTKKKMASRSQQVSTNSSLHCFHTSSVTLINRFIWGSLVQVICIPYSMRRVYYASFCPLKIKLTEML